MPARSQARYVAFQTDSAPASPALKLAAPARLASAQNAAQYVVIAPTVLADTAAVLADYRRQQNLTAKVVTLDQVYDEFAYGIPTPHALQQFLATAYNIWSVRPAYVLLAGNGTYDYRNLQGKNDNLLPPLLMGTDYGLFSSDSILGDVNGDGVPDIAIGRLPVVSADQLLQLINKIKTYESRPVTSPSALLIADVPDAGGNFTAGIQQANSTLAGKFTSQMLLAANQPNLAALRQSVQTSLNSGVDLVSYLGHGAVDRLGLNGYLTSSDVPGLQNGNRLPVVVAITCLAGQYGTPGFDSLAEQLVLSAQGGAIAAFAPSGLSFSDDGSQLNLLLMQALKANSLPRLGDSIRQATANYARTAQRATPYWNFNLLGDPAAIYQVPADATTSVTVQATAGANQWGGSITLTAVTTGSGPFTYQWRFNGTSIDGATNSTLTLFSLQFGNAGNYDVIVTSPAGNATSPALPLQVLGQISGQLALEAYTGPLHNGHGVRRVTFKATQVSGAATNLLSTWSVDLTFTPDAHGYGVACYALTNVPAGTTHLSVKTAWNLRQKLSVTFAGGQAVANFTGDHQLPAGDLDDSNQVDAADYARLSASWYHSTDAADLDGSGMTDLDDYLLLANHWNERGDPE